MEIQSSYFLFLLAWSVGFMNLPALVLFMERRPISFKIFFDWCVLVCSFSFSVFTSSLKILWIKLTKKYFVHYSLDHVWIYYMFIYILSACVYINKLHLNQILNTHTYMYIYIYTRANLIYYKHVIIELRSLSYFKYSCESN